MDHWEVASRVKNVIESSQRRLRDMPDGVSGLLGTMRKAGEEKLTSLDDVAR
jgi:hypothetical protein